MMVNIFSHFNDVEVFRADQYHSELMVKDRGAKQKQANIVKKKSKTEEKALKSSRCKSRKQMRRLSKSLRAGQREKQIARDL